MIGRKSFYLVGFACLFTTAVLQAQSPAVLYTWGGTGNVQGWFKNFGTNTVTIANTTDGELTVTETGGAGTGVAISDDFNRISESSFPINNFFGGIDLTGLSSIEYDVGHSGVGPVNVQFFAQASSGSTYVALGADVAVMPGVSTYSLPLGGLTSNQLVFVRTVGMNIRDHVAEGNLTWTLREVRTIGTPLTQRDFVTHEPGTSDNGLQGCYANFDQSAIEGNNGGQNQTGLSQNTFAPPAANTGSLHWVDLAAGGGAAVSWVNGTVFGGDTYGERPTDMSSYTHLIVRLAATNRGGAVASLGIQYFLQTGNFSYFAAGGDQSVPADGAFHDLVFPLAGIANTHLVVAHGVNLRTHADGDLFIDVDNIRAVKLTAQLAADCNQDGRRNVGDVTCYVRLIFAAFLLPRQPTTPPCGGALGDAGNLAVLDINGDASLDAADVTYLATYLFMGGPAPVQGESCFDLGGCPANEFGCI